MVTGELQKEIIRIYEYERFDTENITSKDFLKHGIQAHQVAERLYSGSLGMNAAIKFLRAMGYKMEIKIVKK